jgi:predicted CXXCH cytochrome family protein
VDEEIVYQDRPIYEDPLPQALSFLGYTDTETKLVVCGNCHVDAQGDWVATAHADAWAGLQSSGGAQPFCEGCHTVNELGNTLAEPAGYNATGEVRYHDVQCESCHGPGLTHVDNPLEENAPLPLIDVGANADQGCAECHEGTHHPFAEEWNLSRHGGASTNKDKRNRDGCKDCHGGEGALRAWGLNTEFVEQGQNQQIGITCAVCHDPHANEHEGQLRYSVSVAEIGQNLCMKCHDRRSIPDVGSSSSGPHAPQGPLLLGEVGTVGWTPPNFAYDVEEIRGSHGSEANTRLCATCHVNSYDAVDAATGSHVFTVTGHRFLPTPCVDANEVPTTDQSCANTVTARNFSSCTTSGCHGDETAALSAMTLAQSRIASRVAELAALLAQVPPSEFSSSDAVFTIAEGAKFNQQLGEIESSAIHNVFMTEALLLGSIEAVEDYYGPFPSSPSDAPEALRLLIDKWGS